VLLWIINQESQNQRQSLKPWRKICKEGWLTHVVYHSVPWITPCTGQKDCKTAIQLSVVWVYACMCQFDSTRYGISGAQFTTEENHHLTKFIHPNICMLINALNSIWWHKNIIKNRKSYIYQTIIQSILVYGAEVWQIPTREINKSLSTEMDVLGRSAWKSRKGRIKNEHTKEITGVKGKPNIIDITQKKRLQWYGHAKRMREDRIPKLIMEWIPLERRKRGRPRKTRIGVQAAMITRNLELDQWRNREEWRLVSGRRWQLL